LRVKTLGLLIVVLLTTKCFETVVDNIVDLLAVRRRPGRLYSLLSVFFELAENLIKISERAESLANLNNAVPRPVMSAGLSFHTITGCVGGFVLLALIQNYQSLVARAQTLRWNVALQDSATALHPPEYSPTADADPSVRHEVLVPMPTRLSVERKSDRLSVGFHLASPRKVKITVGKKMSIGVKVEMRVYAKGDARPQSPGSIGYASIKEPITPSELGFLNGRAFLKSADGGISAPAKRYVVEEDVSIFETDIPAQHMWSPESGRYSVIWAEKLKTVR
jgi:hypothetical protein